MSGIRNLTPPAIAIAVGVITGKYHVLPLIPKEIFVVLPNRGTLTPSNSGYYTFHPTFYNLEQEQKAKSGFNIPYLLSKSKTKPVSCQALTPGW
jgi:hypothetical protein